jgi:hypothetical protein
MAIASAPLGSGGASRRLLLVLLLAAVALGLPARAEAYGWPFKPFDRQHPVRGFFGDPRIGNHGHSRQFHFGVDVSAPNGTPVYSTLTGVVSQIPGHWDALAVDGAGGVSFEYWHIVPTVRPGSRVVAYRTIVGHVEKPWAHVHFSERRNGVYVNPLRAGAMRPFVDYTEPRVVALRRHGDDVVAHVADETPLLVPKPWSNLPVMPALVRWRPAGSSRWTVAADFRWTIPGASAFGAIFAAATSQNHVRAPGRYLVRLAGAPARGRIVVEVRDLAGNASQTTGIAR